MQSLCNRFISKDVDKEICKLNKIAAEASTDSPDEDPVRNIGYLIVAVIMNFVFFL